MNNMENIFAKYLTTTLFFLVNVAFPSELQHTAPAQGYKTTHRIVNCSLWGLSDVYILHSLWWEYLLHMGLLIRR